MKHLLINAGNLNGAGARAVGVNLIPALTRALDGCRFSIWLPDHPSFRELALPGRVSVSYQPIRSGGVNDLARLRQLLVDLPLLARRIAPDACLTLGDLAPAFLPCPQLVLFHQPLLVYSSEESGGQGWSPLKRLFLERYFAWVSGSVERFIVQTEVMAERLARRYRVPAGRIAVIPQPVPGHVMAGALSTQPDPRIAGCAKELKLLFLAGYYPHKNHRALPRLIEELRSRGSGRRVHFFLTLNEAEIGDPALLQAIRENPDLVTNLGTLPMAQVPGALRAASALFLPTLAESYGLIYLEAMACGLPILTSDRDFARWMCRDAAGYFDPLDPASMAAAIEAFPPAPEARAPELFRHMLARFPQDWDVVARQFARLIGESTEHG